MKTDLPSDLHFAHEERFPFALITALLLLLSTSGYGQPVIAGKVSPGVKNFTGLNGRVFYSVADSLFVSRGAPGDTWLVKKTGETILRVSTVSNGDQMFFITRSGTAESLWSSNGVQGNAVKIGTFQEVEPLISFAGVVYLGITTPEYGKELWKLSGGLLTLIKDVNPGAGHGFAGELTEAAGQLYFKGSSPLASGIWKTNGTSAGTTLAARTDFLDWSELTSVNGTFFFTRSYTDFWEVTAELWKSNGTTASTALVTQWTEGQVYNELKHLTAYKGKLYFIHKYNYDYLLMASDGVTTTEIKNVGFDGDVPTMIVANDKLVLNTETQNMMIYLYSSDGTTSGTQPFHDFGPYLMPDSENTKIIPAGGKVYFIDELTPAVPRHPWESDLTTTNTRPFKELFDFTASPTSNLTGAGDRIFFTTPLGNSSLQLWSYSPEQKPAPSSCAGSGTITREYWSNITGRLVSSIPVNQSATAKETLTTLSTPLNIGDNYGSRIRGFVCPPASGNYRFSIASNDNSELWLSTDETQEQKQKIAFVDGYTNPGQYDKYSSQTSVSVLLEKGKRYYIEVLHKEGVGTDHLSVGWVLPDGTVERPIQGRNLVPFAPASGTIIRELWTGIRGSTVASIPLSASATSVESLTILEGPVNAGTNYGARIRGYVTVPASGSYTFYLSSNDNSELWLGMNESAATKRRIAFVNGATGIRQWDKVSSQRSEAIQLVKDQRYYIEVLHKQGSGSDHVAVGWALPDGSMERPIPGIRLSPFNVQPATATASATAFTSESTVIEEKMTMVISPNPAEDKTTVISIEGISSSDTGNILITMFSVDGRIVFTKSESCVNGCEAIPLKFDPGLLPGVYLVRVGLGNTSFTQRVVIR